jgi:hypothetical protein
MPAKATVFRWLASNQEFRRCRSPRGYVCRPSDVAIEGGMLSA